MVRMTAYKMIFDDVTDFVLCFRNPTVWTVVDID